MGLVFFQIPTLFINKSSQGRKSVREKSTFFCKLSFKRKSWASHQLKKMFALLASYFIFAEERAREKGAQSLWSIRNRSAVPTKAQKTTSFLPMVFDTKRPPSPNQDNIESSPYSLAFN